MALVEARNTIDAHWLSRARSPTFALPALGRPQLDASLPDFMDLREQLQSTLGSAYTLERELGGGGMSRVFVADETRLRRKVVVKVLSPELAQGISAERFQREIQLAASLQQANIVPCSARVMRAARRTSRCPSSMARACACGWRAGR